MFPKSKDTFKEPVGWILFDGNCGFCTGSIHPFESWLHNLGFGLAPLQEGWVQERLGIERGEIPPEMKVISDAGEILGGIDAWLHILAQSAWTWPMYFLGHRPGVHGILDFGYRWIARNRYRWGDRCEIAHRGHRHD
jgi:predicted DCC family thiol-disulfide oxidoreductase YuxK